MRRIASATLAIVLAMTALGAAGQFRPPASTLIERAKSVFAASETPVNCAAIDASWIQIDVPLSSSAKPLVPGRVVSVSDGAIAVLVIVNRVTSDGAAEAIDFSTSVKVSAAIIRTSAANEVLRFDPAARSKSELSSSNGAAIDSVSFCYRINIPAPPAPAQPNQNPVQTNAPASPTPIEFDLGAIQTVNAHASTAVADANATVVAAQTALAASEAGAKDLRATVAVQASQIALLESTITAPTATPTPALTGVALFAASSDADFSKLTLTSKGWKIDGGLIADATTVQDWVTLPAIPGLGPDQAMEAEIQLGDGGACPRNFGLALRGADNGFVAGGITWACDQVVELWAGQTQLAHVQTAALGGDWHLYRLEVRGATVRMFIDRVLVLETTTSQLGGGQLAIWSNGASLKVRALRVYNLS